MCDHRGRRELMNHIGKKKKKKICPLCTKQGDMHDYIYAYAFANTSIMLKNIMQYHVNAKWNTYVGQKGMLLFF